MLQVGATGIEEEENISRIVYQDDSFLLAYFDYFKK
jgi:hypothetical protein